LHIYDIDKSRHQEIQFVFEASHLDLEWSICAETPSKLLIYSEDPQIVVFEVNYKEDINNFFTKSHLITIDCLKGDKKIISPLITNQKLLQIEGFSKQYSVSLIRMKDPVYYDNAHLIADNGSLLTPPMPNKKLKSPAAVEEKPKRCDYHTLVDRVESIKKHTERFQCDIKVIEEVEQIKKDIQEKISKKMQTAKEKREEYDKIIQERYEIWRKGRQWQGDVEEPKKVDFRKYLGLYKEIKQIQKSLKISGKAKIRQNSREKGSHYIEKKV